MGKGKFWWSVSRLLTYLRCPYAYYLTYVNHVEVPNPWYLTFGAAVHQAIEVCHHGNSHQHFQPTSDRPLFFHDAKAFGGFWIGLWNRTASQVEMEQGILWDHEGQRDQLTGLGYNMLAGTKDGRHRGYYDSILHPPLPIQVLAVELPIKVDLWGFHFRAKIDQVWRVTLADGDHTALVDLTTGRSDEIKFLQTTAYDIAFRRWCEADPRARQRFGTGADRHFIWVLREEKLHPTKPQALQTFREDLERAAAGVQDGDFHETQQDNVCRTCPFRELCGKTVGEAIPTTNSGTTTTIVLPTRPPKPHPRQLHFKGGAKGGWIQGSQVRGED